VSKTVIRLILGSNGKRKAGGVSRVATGEEERAMGNETKLTSKSQSDTIVENLEEEKGPQGWPPRFFIWS